MIYTRDFKDRAESLSNFDYDLGKPKLLLGAICPKCPNWGQSIYLTTLIAAINPLT